MDWSKTKSIFIGVFLILNIFLYSQYIETYNGNQLADKAQIEKPHKENIDSKLKEDNITYESLPATVESAPFISAQVKTYSMSEFPNNSNQQYKLVSDNKLIVDFKTPVKLSSTKESNVLQEFVNQYVYEGASFVLWEIDEEARTATFFQSVNDWTVYYNKKAQVKIHWNTKDEVFMYEQTMLEKVKEMERKKKIIPALQILQVLYAQQLLQTDDHITFMKLGYMTHVDVTQKQVFAPTWEVHVEKGSGKEAFYLVNAVDGKVTEPKDIQEVVEE